MQFRKRINIAPGVQLNLSKGGISVTLGPRGLRYTFGPSGQHYSVGLPGTGVYYKGKVKKRADQADEPQDDAPARKPRRSRAKASQQEAVMQPAVPDAPSTASPTEQAFQRGAASYAQGDYRAAHEAFSPLTENADYLSDALLMAGLSASYLDDHATAIDSLITLIEQGRAPLPSEDRSLTARYLPDATVSVPVTQFAAIDMPLTASMATLLLAELLSAQARHDEAIEFIRDLFDSNPDDQVYLLSLADLYAQEQRLDDLHQVLSQNSKHIETDDDVSLGLMYYWAVALTAKDLFDAADEVYKTAMRKAEHNEELSRLLRYGHADLLERMGRPADARKAFERLYGLEPGFYDVAQRLEALKQA